MMPLSSIVRVVPSTNIASIFIATSKCVHLMLFPTFLAILSESIAFQEAPIVSLTTGQIVGRRVTLKNEFLNQVDQYLGIPYAKPPVKDRRFRGTSYPAESWDGVTNATVFGPVCPQVIPDIISSMPRWVQKPLEDSRPFLEENMDEDCLYANVYVPIRRSANAVAVFIHGDSFQSGAGSMYDGSVLSSYGDVIIVTFNYRLGILGFLSSGSPHSPGNYGLDDQIAVLQWVQDNIAAFGGDPQKVTVIGAGTGGACAGLLMLSNKTKGLFSRVIAQSGAPLSPWAISGNPMGFYKMVSRDTGCDDTDPKEVMSCLRNISFKDFVQLDIPTPLYSVSFGPVVDGYLIENDPEVMLQEVKAGRRSLTTSTYMTGLTKNEAFYHIGESVDALGRIDKDSFDQILHGFVQNNFGFNLITSGVIRDTISYEYTDWTAGKNNPYTMTTSLQDIITDHQWVTPAIRTLKQLDDADVTTYFYLFTHRPRLSINPRWAGPVHLEELPFVFGAPIISSPLSVFRSNFTKADAHVSLALMTYWSNFIKTGNPNSPSLQESTDIHRHFGPVFEYKDSDEWPIFNNTYQSIMYLSSRSKVKDYYRVHQTSLWEDLIPKLESRLINDETLPRDSIGSSVNAETTPKTVEYNISPTLHNVNTSQTMTTNGTPPLDANENDTLRHEGYMVELSMVIAVGGFFLLINLIILGIIYYLRDRKKMESKLAAKYLAYLETIKKKRTNGRGFMQCTPDSGIGSATLLNSHNGKNNTYISGTIPGNRDGTIRINEEGEIEFEV